MSHAGLSSLVAPAPVLDLFREPVRRLVQRTLRPYRRTEHGRIYLGEGQPVMVFPLLGNIQHSGGLRNDLADAGFSVHGWGLEVDSGLDKFGFNRALRLLEEQVIEVFEAERQTVTLLGWGLSGVYAREAAKRTSPLVRQVITVATPFNTAADPWHRCRLLRELESEGARLDASVWQRLRQRPPVPCTSIYSVNDGVVPWRLCVDVESATSENIEIPAAAHLDLARHPKALEAITQRLAQPEDRWRAFEP